ncbi:MAG: hypothetical protein JRE23_18720 [Deltaproteobacteria bacterium]|nr:hypothetical protein [Deltaproteobacteria bacterium]
MNRNFLFSTKVFRIITIVIIGIPLLASSPVNSNLPINTVEDLSFQEMVESSLVDLERGVPLKDNNSENRNEGGGGVVFHNNIIGMYSRTQKTWYLKGANNDGWANVSTVRFGSTDSNWIPLVGDWNGDGKDTIGISTLSSWIPVAGDWNGDGTDTVGMYSRTQKTWYLKGANVDGWGGVCHDGPLWLNG